MTDTEKEPNMRHAVEKTAGHAAADRYWSEADFESELARTASLIRERGVKASLDGDAELAALCKAVFTLL